jgi:predicted GTPase
MLTADIFELRSRIGTALFALGAMMKEVGVQPDNAETIQSLINGLKDPFVVMVAGEVNAGKSMLLNALFGAELSETNSVPTTDRVLYFRHGEKAQTTDHAAHSA